ncbi:MAG: asparagine synthase-related protein [Paracoccaceae bacterium]
MTRAIAGMLCLDGSAADPARVHAMLDALVRPGLAVERRLISEGPVALGALGLAPAAPAPEPVARAAGGLRMVADLPDAEIAEAGTLAAALAEDRSALIVEDAALAVWSAETGKLTLFRDLFGVRPLRYTHQAGRYLAFASHPRALLATGLASRRIDPTGLANAAVTADAPAPSTLFAEIRAVEPGHALTLTLSSGSKPRSRARDRLPLGRALALDTDPGEIACEIRRLLDRAVRRRLPGGPAAAHVSGGLDSASVACLAARAEAEAGRTLRGYALVETPDPRWPALPDERPFAQAVAVAAGIELRAVPACGLLRELAEIDPDTGLAIGAGEPETQILGDARAAEITTILTGWGGDQGVSHKGTGAQAELLLRGAFRCLVRDLRARSAAMGQAWPRLFWHRALLPCVPHALRRAAGRALEGANLREETRAAHLRFLRAELRPLVHPPHLRDGPDSRANRRRALGHPVLAARLEALALRGLDEGIGYAHPLLDRALLDLVLRVPGRVLDRPQRPRALLRAAMTGMLPDPVRERVMKLDPTPAEPFRRSADWEGLAARAERVAALPAAREVLDVRALAVAVAGIPPLGARLAEPTSRPDPPFADALRLGLFLSAQTRADR